MVVGHEGPLDVLAAIALGGVAGSAGLLLVGRPSLRPSGPQLTDALARSGLEVKSLERSDPGMKPGGMATREITAVADVIAVDTKKSTVTVKNKEGETFDLNIRDPEQLKLIKKGDQIQATYTEAVAVSLKPAPAAAAKKK